ncbi:hypothetical protein [Paraburkholderia sp. BL6669N2]|uniref:hypothetical protein n=1 Tax=Paraburkholderia sp. BL6669N2 TaxID=1938807 RepID=UPI000E23FE1C|nr:hypothetical protein [Paraburkholderia sp. BL6669N2]
MPGLASIGTVQEDTGDPTTHGKRAANAPRFQANAFVVCRVPGVPDVARLTKLAANLTVRVRLFQARF